jgi:hypothetical protein
MYDNKLVGYYGTEMYPIQCLTTFFIVPEFRKFKTIIWKYITRDFTADFISSLFKINTRAIAYLQNNGGVIINEVTGENKPVVILKFKRST